MIQINAAIRAARHIPVREVRRVFSRFLLSLGLLPIPSAAPVAPPFFAYGTDISGFFSLRHFIENPPVWSKLRRRAEIPRSNRQNAAMRVNDSKTNGAGTVLLSIVAIALAGMVGTIGLIHQVGELGPKVGDMVAFDPLDPISRDMHARLTAMPTENEPGVACVLDVRAMHAGGGSVVIEGREPRSGFGYRVHWAGARSSNDGADCGTSADLYINVEDVELLAMAAGGYGASTARHPGVPWRSASAQ